MGPSFIPYLRRRVGESLGTTIHDGLDPMTLVARGAALYAATAGLDATPATPTPEPTGRRLWLHYPAMSADLLPHVAGRVLEGPGPCPTEVRFVRTDGNWASEWVAVTAQGEILVMLNLVPRKRNVFRIEGRAQGQTVDVAPSQITVVQGLTITDPPLSRSVGVALANDRVRTYLERGPRSPLSAPLFIERFTAWLVAKRARCSPFPSSRASLNRPISADWSEGSKLVAKH